MKKKFVSILTATLSSAAIIASSSVSGAFNENKDPNGNGRIDLGDAITIIQYLSGGFNPADLSELDMNDNDIVSIVDSDAVQRYILGLSTNSIFPEISETSANALANISNNISATSLSRNYLVYNAINGNYLRSYSLSVNAPTGRGVVGSTDDRVPSWTNRGVAKIICDRSQNSTGYLGSGFVVDNHTIATAAHVVYDTETNSAKQLSEILLFDSNHTAHSFTPVEYHFPQTFKDASGYTTINDYALITVEEDLEDYMSFELGAITDSAVQHQLTISTVGFPYQLNPGTTNSKIINTGTLHDERLSTGSITFADNDNIRYTADVSGGNSGGPVFVEEYLAGKTHFTVVGITIAEPSRNFSTYNIGLRFDVNTLTFYNGNTNIQY